jgi:allophanate hydrolase subunit 2
MEGARIEHRAGADIISDATCLGSVQVPGDGQPIALLADRQTTGGYAKIATICAADVPRLAQRLPGDRVRFARATVAEAVELFRREATLFAEMKRLRAEWRSRPQVAQGTWRVTVNGKPHLVEWSL